MKYILPLISFFLPLFTFAANNAPINFEQVNHTISRGGAPSQPENMHFLQSRRIKTIINLQGGDLELLMFPSETPSGIRNEKNAAHSLNMQYAHLAVPAVGLVTKRMKSKIRSLVKTMLRPENQPLYVHCLQGSDRTSLIVSLFLHCSGAPNSRMRAKHNGVTQIFTQGLDLFYREAINTPGWCE